MYIVDMIVDNSLRFIIYLSNTKWNVQWVYQNTSRNVSLLSKMSLGLIELSRRLDRNSQPANPASNEIAHLWSFVAWDAGGNAIIYPSLCPILFWMLYILVRICRKLYILQLADLQFVFLSLYHFAKCPLCLYWNGSLYMY